MTSTTTNVIRCVVLSIVLISITRWSLAQGTITIHEAILQKRVEVTARGAGIETVIGTVRRAPGTDPLMLSIPVGTLFVPNSTVQTMVTIAQTTIDLTTRDSADFSVRVACANRQLDIPSSANTFTVEPTRRQEALSSVLPVLTESKAPSAVVQALVWIVTDNATYSDLGILVSGDTGLVRIGAAPRTINEAAAAQAIMLLERVGGDLTRRRIWADRQRVCKFIGTADAEVTAWCQRILAADGGASASARKKSRRPDAGPAGGFDVIVPSDERSYARSSEFQISFWIYSARNARNGKPDVNVDYNFYQRLPEGEKFFNRTPPQQLNAKTLPPAFSSEELVAGVGVPLTSFPAGNYRLEIKVTDRVSGQTVTRDVYFAVRAE